MTLRPRLLLPSLLALALAPPARGELPLIRLDRVTPLGGAAGSVVEVEIQGRDLEGAKTLHFDHPGLRAEWVKDRHFRVTVAADVPPGAYDLRAAGDFGLSAGRLFAVSRGLTEVQEKEPNDTPETSQAVPFNSALNGASDGNGDDFYRLPAKKGERVTVEAQAFRLDSRMRAVLTLSTADGKELAQSKPYFDRTDPLLDAVIPVDGDYVVRVHDATFSGGLPYRLTVGNRPLVENAFPCAVVPGETAELTILGRNLPGGKPAEGAQVNGLPLDEIALAYPAPGGPAPGLGAGAGSLFPLPSPSLGARGFQARPKGLEDALNAVTLLAADAPVAREHEPNDDAVKAQDIPTPAVVAGRLDARGDADWYAFAAKKGDTIALDLYCERLDLPGDPRLVVTNDKGQELSTLDDHGPRFNSLDMYNRDPQGTFNVPADGTYRVLVQDTYGAGGPRFVYALRVAKASPDLAPVVFHETPSDPTCPVVRQGGSAFVELALNRRDGFNGPVTIEAEGLPAGVTCPPVRVSPQGQFAPVVFTAADDAPEWSGAVRLKAVATIDGTRVERPVGCSRRRWEQNNISTSRSSREIGLAVRPKAPYGLKAQDAPVTVAAGASAEATVSVLRHWPDFKGKVQVVGLDLPPGFNANAADIPEGKGEARLKVTVAGNVPPGTYTVAFRGDAQVPYNKDPKATNRPNVRVADPSTPLTVTVTAAAKK